MFFAYYCFVIGGRTIIAYQLKALDTNFRIFKLLGFLHLPNVVIISVMYVLNVDSVMYVLNVNQ